MKWRRSQKTVETQLPGGNQGNLYLGRENKALVQLCWEVTISLTQSTQNTSDLPISILLFKAYLMMSPSMFFYDMELSNLVPFDTTSDRALALRQLTSMGSILDCQHGILRQTLSTWVTILGLWPSPNTFQLCCLRKSDHL